MWMSALKENDLHFFYYYYYYYLEIYLPNINSIFEYSVLDKIRLYCKVY